MANEDKAARYHRLRRRVSLAGTLLTGLVLALLLVSGGSAWLHAAALGVAGGAPVVAVFLYVVFLAVLLEGLRLPLGVYQEFVLERRYGLSTQPPAGWWLDWLKGFVLMLVFAGPAAVAVTTLQRWAPVWWWLAAAAGCAVVLVALAVVAPVTLMPLFHDVRPLDRPPLVERLVTLASRAGARVLGVYEWRLGGRTTRANAALVGLGRTRRILLSDTLLADHSDDEIEVILAHELAHHVHRDIWTGLALETALLLAGFFLADLVLRRYAGLFGLAPDAVAALPLLLLSCGAASVVLRPLSNAWLRAHERRADRFALDLTRNAQAFITAMRRLAARNMAEERPSAVVRWLFYTHPPTSARVAAAERWLTERGGAPPLSGNGR